MNTHVVLDTDPDVVGLEPDVLRRIRQTVACRDADFLPRVEGAGEIFEKDGVRVQRMFNGVLVEEGCYFGYMTTPIISRLGGVHEPQEEVVVHAILERLAAEVADGATTRPLAIELGSFWSYYSMWFCSALPGSSAVCIEPDPQFFEVGRRNAALNGLTDRMTFVPGGIGETASGAFPFTAESDGITRETRAYDLGSLLELGDASRVEVLYCDIQGYETPFLEHVSEDLRAGKVRFLVMSTHHMSISGHPLTHQRALDRLVELGAHVIAEHSVSESCSGDGLIAVSFDPVDRDLVVDVSHVRAKDSLFGEVEYAVHDQWHAATVEHKHGHAQKVEVERLRHVVAQLEGEVRRAKRRAQRAQDEVAALRASRTWRFGRVLTAPGRRLRRD